MRNRPLEALRPQIRGIVGGVYIRRCKVHARQFRRSESASLPRGTRSVLYAAFQGRNGGVSGAIRRSGAPGGAVRRKCPAGAGAVPTELTRPLRPVKASGDSTPPIRPWKVWIPAFAGTCSAGRNMIFPRELGGYGPRIRRSGAYRGRISRAFPAGAGMALKTSSVPH